MKIPSRLSPLSLALCALIFCGLPLATSIAADKEAPGYTAKAGPGEVVIKHDTKIVSVAKTALPNVEDFHFVNHQAYIAVKSRGAHGPAACELFDCKNGTLREKVMAHQIKAGKPAWAADWKE